MSFLLFVCSILGACLGRDDPHRQLLADTVAATHRLVVITPSLTPYQTVSLTNPGSVSGSVRFTGTPKGDTVVQVAADQNGCNKVLTITRLARQNGNVANAVVWLTDVRTGRALPLERRFELENNDCSWAPATQAVVAGGTLNVTNDDPLVERAYVTDMSTGDTVAIAPFTDDGEIIPYNTFLRRTGVYEFGVESRPMSRAWVAVFDHPYFAVTKGDGSFSFDGVPPGTHHIRAWHPMLGVTDGVVTVQPGGKATVTLQW